MSDDRVQDEQADYEQAGFDQFEYLQFERDGDVLRVTIDRPGDPLNAVDGTLHHELSRLFPRLQRERVARVVLLTGRGKAFSAGGDFAWFPELSSPAGSRICVSTPAR